MSSVGQVHWHEGLFLQPHHLQTMQRELLDASWRERRMTWMFPYGVIELKLSTDALENMLVRIDRLRAVMPSGIEIDIPGNTDLPALDIKRVFQGSSNSFMIGIALPLWQGGRANTVEPGSDAMAATGAAARRGVQADALIKRIYRVNEVQRSDENTGENPQPLMVRRLNARLVVEGDDFSDLEVLPLLRIVAAAEEQTLPRPDPDYVPPCMVIGGSPRLRFVVRDLTNFIEAARKEHVDKLTRGGFAMENLRPPQMVMMMRLRTLSRFAASLPTLVAGGVGGAGTMAPVEAYLQLREMLGELAALNPARDMFDAPKYDHDNPLPVFLDLDKKIRALCVGEERGNTLELPLVSDGTATVSATMTEEHLTKPNGYWLCIKTKMEPSVLGKLVEDQDKFKLMPKSMIKLNIFGVKMEEDRHPPMGFKSSTDRHYFRIDVGASQKMWDRITSEKAISVRWSELEPLAYEDIRLVMSIP